MKLVLEILFFLKKRGMITMRSSVRKAIVINNINEITYNFTLKLKARKKSQFLLDELNNPLLMRSLNAIKEKQALSVFEAIIKSQRPRVQREFLKGNFNPFISTLSNAINQSENCLKYVKLSISHSNWAALDFLLTFQKVRENISQAPSILKSIENLSSYRHMSVAMKKEIFQLFGKTYEKSKKSKRKVVQDKVAPHKENTSQRFLPIKPLNTEDTLEFFYKIQEEFQQLIAFQALSKKRKQKPIEDTDVSMLSHTKRVLVETTKNPIVLLPKATASVESKVAHTEQKTTASVELIVTSAEPKIMTPLILNGLERIKTLSVMIPHYTDNPHTLFSIKEHNKRFGNQEGSLLEVEQNLSSSTIHSNK
jgi:hypothetical protein